MVSLTLHAALVLAFLALLEGGRRQAREQPLARLIYVEPAPPPAPGLSLSPPALPPTVPAQIERLAVQEPEHSPRPKREHRRDTTPPVTHPRPPTKPAPAAAPESTRTDAAGVGGGRGDTLGGTAEGRPGGTVGGLGDAPLALRDVAAQPELVERVLPEYPPRARTMQIEGQVVLEVVLDRRGHVEDSVRVTRSIPALDAAAITAIRQWRFRPARDREGRPVRVVMEIPVRFVLR